MKANITVLSVLGFALLVSSCATIVTKSSYPLMINSHPAEATISVLNKKGAEIYTGHTPATVKLKAGSGFFGKAEYQVKLEKAGYVSKTVPVYFKLDGWYFGNILLGGVIGMLIVDPASGAMYKLETEFVDETLVPSTASAQEADLRIYAITDIPVEWKKHLVSIEE